MEDKTLASLFELNKDKLKEQLLGLTLPKDVVKIQSIVESYLDSIFAHESEYRQSLTQAEDYILQGAMSLLNAQQAMVKEFSVKAEQVENTVDMKSESFDEKVSQSGLSKDHYPHALLGSAVGGAVGGLFIGTWGAVFGSIAGTALMLYYASEKISSSKNSVRPLKQTVKSITTQKAVKDKPLDIDTFLKIIYNICDSIDLLINSFRAQIKRVINQYENQERPTLEGDYHSLLEAIQSLIGFERTHEVAEDKYVNKLNERIEEVSEALDSYGINVVDYNGSNDDLFNKMLSPNVLKSKMVTPAFVKNGKIVIKGKIFIKE